MDMLAPVLPVMRNFGIFCQVWSFRDQYDKQKGKLSLKKKIEIVFNGPLYALIARPIKAKLATAVSTIWKFFITLL